MSEEKRLVTAIRRPSSAEGRSGESSSRIRVSGVFCELEDGVSVGWVEGVFKGGGGLGESAKCRVWVRTLHCRQIDALAEGRLGIRRDREAGEQAIESKKSLGTNRASGCMAALLCSTVVMFDEVKEAFSRWKLGRKTPEMTSPLTALVGPKSSPLHQSFLNHLHFAISSSLCG
jgi:hypothetical protein